MRIRRVAVGESKFKNHSVMLILLLCILKLFSTSWSHPTDSKIWKRDAETRETGNEVQKPIVFLTVSSLASQSNNQVDRMLELNWDKVSPNVAGKDSWVRLFDQEPVSNSSNFLVSVKPQSEGYYRTSIRFPEQTFPKNNLTDECLNFWIAYVHENEILSSNCLRAYPNWMYKARSEIGNLSLMDLMIPGTHNTGTYAPFDKSDDNIFNRYLITQEENVWNQLVYGIRYLDLRVAYKISSSSPEKFWITHSSFVTDITVKDIIRQVKDFLNSTNEIVIMDFHRFVNGFKGRRADPRHAELISMLHEELGEYMIPVNLTSWAPLNVLWDSGRRLYVAYANNNSRRQSSFLFPGVRQLWGDVDTKSGLKNYLNQTVCSRRGRLTSAMAQLTPTTAGVIFDLYGGLRTMADDVNRDVTKWFRDEWSDCANIVATDYFLGNNIIEVSIDTNKRKQHG